MDKKENQILCRPDVQTLYIDHFVFHRTFDGHVLLSGIQESPGMRVEQLRFLITEKQAAFFAEQLKALLMDPPGKNAEPSTPSGTANNK